jgi:GT2 family glycosyltransferase
LSAAHTGSARTTDIVPCAVIAVVVLTYNRAHLLRRCIEDVLLRTTPATREIVIWNNGSDDGTNELLRGVSDPRMKIVHHEKNIGTNAYRHAVALTSAPYIVEVDDDVIEAPHHWDERLLEAFRSIPNIGQLAADLKPDPNDAAYCFLEYAREHRNPWTAKQVNDFTILEGPTPGGCAMTSREAYDSVGGFREHKKLVFWHETEAYVRDLRKKGYRTAILQDLQVWHAGGVYYAKPAQAKLDFHSHRARVERRKNIVKRVILRIPLASSLNERHGWFAPPLEYTPPDFSRTRSDVDSRPHEE